MVHPSNSDCPTCKVPAGTVCTKLPGVEVGGRAGVRHDYHPERLAQEGIWPPLESRVNLPTYRQGDAGNAYAAA